MKKGLFFRQSLPKAMYGSVICANADGAIVYKSPFKSEYSSSHYGYSPITRSWSSDKMI
ncbi:MAG: hypothetical protein WC341_03825 [Bacteroidales bacterium]